MFGGIDRFRKLGAFVDRSDNTTYLANVDTIVVACGTSAGNNLTLKADPAPTNPPTTIIAEAEPNYGTPKSITVFVAKGEYWKVINSYRVKSRPLQLGFTE